MIINILQLPSYYIYNFRILIINRSKELGHIFNLGSSYLTKLDVIRGKTEDTLFVRNFTWFDNLSV